MKPVNIHKAKPVKVGGLKPAAPVPDDFNTMFEQEIAALFGAMPAVPTRPRK